MKLSKKIIRSSIVQNILGFIVYLYIKLVHITGKWTIIKSQEYTLHEEDTSHIFAFWHGRLFMAPHLAPQNQIMNVISSGHQDGAMMARVTQFFGFHTIYISRTQSSFGGLRQIISALKKGENIAMTPDGSRGPARQINGNIIEIARLTGATIIPISFSAQKRHIFRSWDSFMLPYFFSKGRLIYGRKMVIRHDATAEMITNLKHQLTDELNRITDLVDIW